MPEKNASICIQSTYCNNQADSEQGREQERQRQSHMVDGVKAMPYLLQWLGVLRDD